MQVVARYPALPVACLHSQLPRDQTSSILKRMLFPSSAEDTLLLYVTPERVAKSKLFMTKLQKCWEMKKLKLLAIDEVRSRDETYGIRVHFMHAISPFALRDKHFRRFTAALNGDMIFGPTTTILA